MLEIKNDDFLGYHDLICHCYGPTKIFMSLHIEFDSSKNILYIHDIIDNLELRVKEKFDIDLVVHMDPIDLNCEITNQYKSIINDILNGISDNLSFHDFRAVVTSNNINLIFDISYPFNFHLTENEINQLINNELLNEKVKINLIITFDKEFIT